MAFIDLCTAGAAAIFSHLGEAATYRHQNGEVVSTDVIRDPDVLIVGPFESDSAERRTEIEMLRADVGVPLRGDVIVIGEANYEVQDLLDDDGMVVRVTVK